MVERAPVPDGVAGALAARAMLNAFDVAYEGTPTWDIGRPQGAVLRLVDAGAIVGDVIDVGCGTGEHAMLLARLGHRVMGVDLAAGAIERAQAKAASAASARPADTAPTGTAPTGAAPTGAAPTGEAGRAGEAPPEGRVRTAGRPTFLVHDALALPALADRFDTALDVGLFHVLQPPDRVRYAEGLAQVVRPDGRAFVICWSARNPFGYGPERISRTVLRRTFVAATGWRIAVIAPEVLETRMPQGTVHAWCAHLRRR